MKQRILMIALATLLVSACNKSPDAMQSAGATADARMATAGPVIETAGAQAGNAAGTAAVMAGHAGGTVGAMAGDAGAAAKAMIENRLIARVWEWRETSVDGGATTQSPDPAQYTLTFAPGGAVAVTADCKKAAGTYTADEAGAMKLDVKVTTTDPCATGSLADVFVEEIAQIDTWRVDETSLTLGLANAAGTMRFTAR